MESSEIINKNKIEVIRRIFLFVNREGDVGYVLGQIIRYQLNLTV